MSLVAKTNVPAPKKANASGTRQQASGKNESSALIKEPVASSEAFCGFIVSSSLYLFEQLSRLAFKRWNIQKKFLKIFFIAQLMHPKIRDSWLIGPTDFMIVQEISIPRQRPFEPKNGKPDFSHQLVAVPEMAHAMIGKLVHSFDRPIAIIRRQHRQPNEVSFQPFI